MNDLIVNSQLDEKQKKLVDDFCSKGLPGITMVDDALLFSTYELFLQGQSLSDVSGKMKLNYGLVCYLAMKYRWLEKRSEHLENLHTEIANKLKQVRLQSIDAINSLLGEGVKTVSDSISKYAKTGDFKHLKGFGIRNLTDFKRAVEILEKLLPSKENETKINISLGDNKIETRESVVTETRNGKFSNEEKAILIKHMANIKK